MQLQYMHIKLLKIDNMLDNPHRFGTRLRDRKVEFCNTNRVVTLIANNILGFERMGPNIIIADQPQHRAINIYYQIRLLHLSNFSCILTYER
jgi:hypothetical protein